MSKLSGFAVKIALTRKLRDFVVNSYFNFAQQILTCEATFTFAKQNLNQTKFINPIPLPYIIMEGDFL